MNAAVGGGPDKLPFDFKNRRWPIQYHYKVPIDKDKKRKLLPN